MSSQLRTALALASAALVLPCHAADSPDCAVVRKAHDAIETAVGMRQYQGFASLMGTTRDDGLVRVLTKDKQYVKIGGRWSVQDRAEALRARKASGTGSFTQCRAAGIENVGNVSTTRWDYQSFALDARMWIGAEGLPYKIVSDRALMAGGGTLTYRYEYGAFEAPR